MKSLKQLLPRIRAAFSANRVAATATWLAGLAAFIAGLAGVLPTHWANLALVGAGLLTKVVTALHFMHGAQKFDKLSAQPTVIQAPVLQVPSSSPPAQIH